MSDLPKGPRRLAIYAAELQQKINGFIVTVANYHERLASAENKIRNQEDTIGYLHKEAERIVEECELAHAQRERAEGDARRFKWWFENGDNTDETLLEIKRKRGMGEKVTLDEWRTALDGAMNKRR